MIVFNKTKFNVNESVEGQSIEEKMRNVTLSGEPIDNAAPLIYTDKKDGALPQYDIRADRWAIALETTDRVTRANIAKSQEKQEPATQQTQQLNTKQSKAE